MSSCKVKTWATRIIPRYYTSHSIQKPERRGTFIFLSLTTTIILPTFRLSQLDVHLSQVYNVRNYSEDQRSQMIVDIEAITSNCEYISRCPQK